MRNTLYSVLRTLNTDEGDAMCLSKQLHTGLICDDNSGMIGISFILMTIVSKVADSMTGFSIISICSSSTYSPVIVCPSLSLSIIPRHI